MTQTSEQGQYSASESPATGGHTLGPWEAMDWYPGFGKPEERPHAFVWAPDSVEEGVAWIVPGSSAEANANLIAAAPELLAVAHEARGVHRGECNQPDCPLLTHLDAIIAKAEGRSE